MKDTKAGFTLLEVILVVAISTLLFMSVVIGIGSRIATGRYETASTEITDYLRDVYTIALNTENNREGIEGAREYCTLYSATKINGKTGNKLFVNSDLNSDNPPAIKATDVEPGRTNCAIYGKALYFGAKDGEVHVFDVVGDAISNTLKKDSSGNIIEENGEGVTDLKEMENMSVLKQLEYVRADIFAAIPEVNNSQELSILTSLNNCRISPAASQTTYRPNWGALFKTANFGGDTSRNANNDFVGMVMIVRAPATGNVSTFFYERPERDNDQWDGFLAVARRSDVWLNIFDDDNQNSIGCGPYSENESDYKDFVEKYSPVQLMQQQKNREDNDPGSVPKNEGFCIGSDDFYVAISGLKKFVEFIPGGQNASAIKLNESTSKEENPCYGALN